MSTQTYDRNLRAMKFYSTAISGRKNDNSQITMYYADAAGNELVRIEERIPGGDRDTVHMWAQTISGSNYSDYWPNYDHYVIYNPWVESTYSGTI